MMCKCKSGCINRRCACLKNGQACTDECQCQRCQNPLNGVDTTNLSMCVIQNIQAYKALSQTALNRAHQLPCEHANVPLKTLLTGYECTECSEDYSYSLCWNEVVQENNSWHCVLAPLLLVVLPLTIWSMVTPKRSLQDRVAGTWLVPR